MNEVEEIKHRLDIVDFISQYLTLKKAGANWKGNCPFHQEKTPSFMVSKDKQIFKCFGCSEGGDIFDFIMKIEALDFREALEVLASKAGVVLTPRRQVQFQNHTADFSAGPSLKNQLLKINDLTTRLWQKILADHPKAKVARDYLVKRKVDEKTQKFFALGYAPEGWQTTLDFLKKKGFKENEIAATGILVKKENGGYYDRFRGRLVFPIKNVMGQIVAFTGRVLEGQEEKEGQDAPKYINSSESLVYSKSRILYGLDTAKVSIKKENKVIVVEGNMDVLRSQSNGFLNTVASSGTALTEDHLKILNRFTNNILIAFDADVAGQIATERIIELALNTETSLKIIETPKGFKDADEVISKNPELWQKAIDDALPVIEYYLEKTAKEYNGEQRETKGMERETKGMEEETMGKMTVETKKKISKKLLPIIARLADPIEKSHYLQMLGKKLGVPEQALEDAITKFEIRNSKFETNSKSKITNPKHEALTPKERLLGLLAAYPEERKKYEELYKELKAGYNKNIDALAFTIKEDCKTDSQEEIDKEIAEGAKHLVEKEREKMKIDFANRIKTAEEKGDIKEVQRLILELQKLI